jgi:membrane fusion protein (multidrug efflux system)
VGGVVLVLALGWWLFGAEVQVCETTDRVRLEIVPARPWRAVAWFSPASARRLRSGQLARLRLKGFSSAQDRVFLATVAEVGTETCQGQLRVELDVFSDRCARLPVERGHTGSAEVEVERVTPVVVLVRAGGHLLSR